MHQLFIFTTTNLNSPKNQYQSCARQFTDVLLPPSVKVTGPHRNCIGMLVIDFSTLRLMHHNTRGLFG